MPLRRLLLFVSVALVVDTSAYAAITPLLPTLSEEHDLSKSASGILTAAYPAGTLLLSLPAAWLITVIGSKRTLILGLATLAFASLSFGIAGTAPLLVAARFVQGAAAAAMWAGALAWLVAMAPRERRAEAIGAATGAAIAGALAGPVLGAAADATSVLAVFAAYVVVPLAMIGWAVRLQGAAPVAAMSLPALRAALAAPVMRGGMWLMALPAIGFGVINTLVPLRLDDLGAGAAVIAAAFLVAVALEAGISPIAGRVADRRGPIWPARIGLGIGGVFVALLPAGGTIFLVAACVAFVAPLLGMIWTPAMAILSTGAQDRGLDVAFGFGLSNLAWGLGAAGGAAGGGALAEATADYVPFLLLALLCVGTALAMRQISMRPALQEA